MPLTEIFVKQNHPEYAAGPAIDYKIVIFTVILKRNRKTNPANETRTRLRRIPAGGFVFPHAPPAGNVIICLTESCFFTLSIRGVSC